MYTTWLASPPLPSPVPPSLPLPFPLLFFSPVFFFLPSPLPHLSLCSPSPPHPFSLFSPFSLFPLLPFLLSSSSPFPSSLHPLSLSLQALDHNPELSRNKGLIPFVLQLLGYSAAPVQTDFLHMTMDDKQLKWRQCFYTLGSLSPKLQAPWLRVFFVILYKVWQDSDIVILPVYNALLLSSSFLYF